MENETLTGALQAMLFASGEPLSIEKISDILEVSSEDAAKLAENTRVAFNSANRGIQIIRAEGSYQMCSNAAYARPVRALLEIRHNAPLSQAALEVLAIIAYNQPVTKAFVEQIRGVDSAGVVGSLCQKGLIEERGRLELPGRPLLYGTTLNFLRCMGISSLEELPPVKHSDSAQNNLEGDISQTAEGAE